MLDSLPGLFELSVNAGVRFLFGLGDVSTHSEFCGILLLMLKMFTAQNTWRQVRRAIEVRHNQVKLESHIVCLYA